MSETCHDATLRQAGAGGRRSGFVRAWTGLLLAALLALPGSLLAQQQAGVISGTVLGPAGQPVQDIVVALVGTNRSTLTNARGQFMFQNVPAGARELQVSALGYRTSTHTVNVTAGQTATPTITLQVSAVALDEVVVTGQAAGTARREIGTSIASVNVQALEAAPVANLSQLMQARAPGVNVMPGGGKSGQGSRIVLRGAASVTQRNEPLIYVDGVRIDNNSATGIAQTSITATAGASWAGLDDINPADIERIEIIRGASAATLYGTEAAAGVIQIFTRRGREGRATWRYNGDFGVLTTPRDWWQVSAYSDWFYDEIVRTGYTQSHQISVSGGSEGFSYYGSLTGRGEDGIMPNAGEDMYSGRLNLTVVPRSDLTVRFNSGFTRRSVQHVPDANNTRGFTINGLVGGPMGQFGTPTAELAAIEAFQHGNRYVGGVTVEHQLTQTLNHRATVGADIFNSDEFQLFPFGAINNVANGYRYNYRRQNLNLNVDYAAQLRMMAGEAFRFTSSAGFQYFSRDQSWISSSGDGFPFIGLETVGSALTTSGSEGRLQERTAGFFGEQQVGYNDFLFLTVGARADAHSAFGDDVSYQVYPKADLSYIVSHHDFLPELFSSMRLRAAWGTAGQQPANFSAVRTWTPDAAVGGQPAVRPGNIGNPNLKAEVSTEIELGADFGLFDDRINLEITRYDQRTKDALYAVRYPPSQGFLSTQLENVGEIENNGWEIGAQGLILERGIVSWSGLVNYSTNSNRIVSLGGGAPIQLQWLQWMREGYPVGSFFGDHIIEYNGEVGWASALLPRDSEGELPEGWDYLGQPLPTRQVQLGSTFNIGPRVAVNLLFDHKGGHMNHDHSLRWLMQAARQVTEGDGPGQTQGVTTAGHTSLRCREMAGDPVTDRICGQGSALTHGHFAFPADFWRMRELTVTYRVPEEWVSRFGMGGTTVSLAGRNLFRWTDYPGLDPEGMYRNDLSDSALRAHNFFDTPLPRHIVFGISTSF